MGCVALSLALLPPPLSFLSPSPSSPSLLSQLDTDSSTCSWGKWAFDVVSAIAGGFKRK